MTSSPSIDEWVDIESLGGLKIAHTPIRSLLTLSQNAVAELGFSYPRNPVMTIAVNQAGRITVFTTVI